MTTKKTKNEVQGRFTIPAFGCRKCDYSGTPPFANAAWANDPDAMCLWCAGTGHPHGDESYGMCDCPPLRKGPLPLADAVLPVPAKLTAAAPELLEALQEMLEAWQEQFGEDACDCMDEPQNAGHVCQCCKAKFAIEKATA